MPKEPKKKNKKLIDDIKKDAEKFIRHYEKMKR